MKRALSAILLACAFSALLALPFTVVHAQTGSAETTAAGNSTTAANSADGSSPNGTYTPLTQLPGIPNIATASSLPAFFNQLYKICIGAAAVFAVLQIMMAGVQFMTNKGSVGQNEAAKSRIQNALLGLLLVLSPAIVFGIINPDILKLNLDFSNLKSDYKAIDPNSVGTNASENTLIANAAANAITSCNVPVTDAQKGCVSTGVNTIFDKFNTCVKPGGVDQACFTTAQADARAKAKSCIPALTDSQASCLENQLTKSFQTAVATGKTTGASCITFANPGTTPVNNQAAQACCTAQKGCQLQSPSSNTFSCKCTSTVVTNHTPKVEYIIESSSPDGACYTSGENPYQTVEICNAADKQFQSTHNGKGQPRGATRNSCAQDSFEWVPYATNAELSNLPSCNQGTL